MVLARQQTRKQFTEAEAAGELGISLEQLRSVIRNLVTEKDTDPGEITVSQLQAADLLLLRMVCASGRANPSSKTA